MENLQRREQDVLIRALVMLIGSGGGANPMAAEVTLSPLDLDRARLGYDLNITAKDDDTLVLSIKER